MLLERKEHSWIQVVLFFSHEAEMQGTYESNFVWNYTRAFKIEQARSVRLIWNRKYSECNLWSLKKFTSACLFQIARKKSCDYVLIIYMEKYEMAYYN